MGIGLPDRTVQQVIHIMGRVRRAVTLGVRVLVRNADGEILLIRHTYVSGWHMPGGAVDRGEAMAEAAVREVREECGVDLLERPRLVSIHTNEALKGRDHVGFFIASQWTEGLHFLKPNAEVAEMGFFALDQLPNETTKPTRSRLDETLNGTPPTLAW